MNSFSVYIVGLCVALSACGGGGAGGGSVSQAPTSNSGSTGGSTSGGSTTGGTSTGNPTPTPTPVPSTGQTFYVLGAIADQTLTVFADGSRAVQFKDSNGTVFTGLAETQALYDILRNETYTVQTTQSGSNAGVQTQSLTTTQNGDGATLSIIVSGIYLDGLDTASILLAESDTYGKAYLAAGTAPTTIPKQTLTYSGNAKITEVSSGGGAVSETGGFTLTLNMAAATPNGTMVTTGMPNYMYASNAIAVNTLTGLLSSQTGTIGRTGGAQQAAMLYGNLFGRGSEGVAGIVRSKSDTPVAYIGHFFGNR